MDILKEAKTDITAFLRLAVGEGGIEKSDDPSFAEQEIAAMAGGN